MKQPTLAVFGHAFFFVTENAVQSRELPDGADLTAALLQLVTEAGTPRALNLLYHPTDLQVVAAECANVSRPKLKAFFEGEYRELNNPATLWGCTRPEPHLDGKFTTLLHYEARPRLEHILQLLESRGVAVRVALPPATALVARSKAQPLDLAVLATVDCYLYYYLNELGIPNVRFLRTADALAEHLGVALASRKNPPAHVLLVADVTPTRPWTEIFDLLETHALREATVTSNWADYLRSIEFQSGDWANLAARPFRWRTQHTWLTAAALFAMAGMTLNYDTTTKHLRARRRAEEVAQLKTSLERQIADLEQTERRYRDAELLSTTVPLANPKPSALLDAVTQALPPTLQLQAFRYQAGTFILEGIAFEGVGQEKGPFAGLIDSLSAGSRPWKLKPVKPALASASWNITGTTAP